MNRSEGPSRIWIWKNTQKGPFRIIQDLPGLSEPGTAGMAGIF